MMWERAKLVTLMSARVPVGVPRNVAPSASHDTSTETSTSSPGCDSQGSDSGSGGDGKCSALRGGTSRTLVFLVLVLLLATWAVRGGRRREGAVGAQEPSATLPPPTASYGPLPPAVIAIAFFYLIRMPETLLILRAQTLGVAVALIPLLWALLHVVRSSTSFLGGSLSDSIGPARTMWIGWLCYVALAAGMALAASAMTAWILFLALGVVAGLTESPERALVTAATRGHHGSGFGVYHEGVPAKDNPVVKADSFRDGTMDHMQNFFDCIKTRKEPNAAVEAGVAARDRDPDHLDVGRLKGQQQGNRVPGARVRVDQERSHRLIPDSEAVPHPFEVRPHGRPRGPGIPPADGLVDARVMVRVQADRHLTAPRVEVDHPPHDRQQQRIVRGPAEVHVEA